MQEERYGKRDRVYSAWHRRLSTRRFIGIEQAQLLSMIDLDAVLYVEYDNRSREPLALIETARDVGQPWKAATVTMNLARRARLAAFVVLYQYSSRQNPADPSWPDIEGFRIKRLWPHPEREWRTLTPEQWAVGLMRIRTWATTRLDRAEAANDPQYFDEPPATSVKARATR